jgi:hypothetical protein
MESICFPPNFAQNLSVNDLLEAVASDERVYQLFEENDTHAIFLTPQLYAIIRRSTVLPPELLPRPVQPNRK